MAAEAKGKPAGAMENKAEAAAAGIKGKPAGAVKKTTKVRVPQGYIDTLLADPPRRVSYGLPEEVLQHPPESEEELELRASLAGMAALCKAADDWERDLIDQYQTNGFAELAEDSDEEA